MPKGPGTYGSKVGRPPKKKFESGGIIEATDIIRQEGDDAMFIEGEEALYDKPNTKVTISIIPMSRNMDDNKKKNKKKKSNGLMDGGMVKYKNGGTIKGCGSAVTGKSYNNNNGSGTF
jgi:hypothetical protein|tara:strand:+ start:123 stop:476 length:354 start_codon:yes stop_codon:yes gene_type:complete